MALGTVARTVRARRALAAAAATGALLALAPLALAAAHITGAHSRNSRALQRPLPVPVAQTASSAAPRCVPAALNTSATLPGNGLTVAPLPGSYDASPYTQISMLGASVHQLAGVRVRGSSSGAHGGRLVAYSQGDGASFVPSTPFSAGERVTVSGTVRTSGAPFTFSFVVAHPDPLPLKLYYPSGRDPNEVMHFSSRPDIEPPRVVVTARSAQTAPGDIFITASSGPRTPGPMIFDEAGNLVWFHPLPRGTEATNLQVLTYQGRSVLSWWQGHIPEQGFGEGEEIVTDTAYRQLARVRAGNGLKVDLHDFEITPAGTALVTFFDPMSCDLSGVHASRSSWVTDGGFQEIDIPTGLVRREWHALDHVPLSDSYNTPLTSSVGWPFDYFHINSVNEPAGQPLLISARNTSAMYELSAQTGQVIKRIGGRHSDVQLGLGAETAYQHDATLLPGGQISVFDNGADPRVHTQSRGLVLSVHGSGASVVTQYLHPGKPLLAGSEGNLQTLPNGDVFIGWGSQPYFSEFSAEGGLLFDAHLVGSYESYRGYRFPWTGAPAEAPAAAGIAPRGRGAVTVYASWNGDTRTASWRVLAGNSTRALRPVAAVARSGFETAIATPARERYVQALALDGAGNVLGASAIVKSRVG